MPRSIAALLFALVFSSACAHPAPQPPKSDPLLDALFQLQPDEQTFVPRKENPALLALLAKHPPLDPFETAAFGTADELLALLDRDPKLVAAVHSNGWTMLHFAAFAGNAAAIGPLVDRGADLEARAVNRFHNTPLQAAMLTGDVPTAAALLQRGASVHATYEKGATPLHVAAELGSVPMLELLLEHGAELNARTEGGETALQVAIAQKRTGAAEFLRERGAR